MVLWAILVIVDNIKKGQRAQLVMHVTRKDHRESSPTRKMEKYHHRGRNEYKKTHSNMLGRQAEARVGVEWQWGGDWMQLCSFSQDSHGFLYNLGRLSFVCPCHLVSLIVFLYFHFLCCIISCDDSLFQFCFRTRAINLLWTPWYQKNLSDPVSLLSFSSFLTWPWTNPKFFFSQIAWRWFILIK